MYPIFLRLGIISNASPALCEDVVLESLRDSYLEATNAMSLRGVPVSEKRVRTITVAMGKAALKARERRLTQLKITTEATGKRLAVAVDGGRIQIRTNRRGRRTAKGFHTYSADWREPKLFIIYELDPQGRKKRLGLVRSDGTLQGTDTLVTLLAAELRAISAGEAESIVFLGDGAKWIWNRISDIAHKAGIPENKIFQCLDFYHAVEHLSIIADAKSFQNENERSRWLERMKKMLKKATPEKFLVELAKSKRRGNAVIRREYQYFKINLAVTNYPKLLKANQPIGSGAIESAVRRVVNLRIKGAGIFWKIENAEAILHLRCQLKSNNWGEFYAGLLSSLAA